MRIPRPFLVLLPFLGFPFQMLPAHVAASRPTMAVLDLGGEVDPAVANVISETIRRKIQGLDRFDLMERDEVRDALVKAHFSLGDLKDEHCFIKVGQLLMVHKVVAGRVREIDSAFSIQVWVTDVESGGVTDRASVIVGDIDKAYGWGVARLVTRLFGGEPAEMMPNGLGSLAYPSVIEPESPAYGVLLVEVWEDDAEIYIDNKWVGLNVIPTYRLKHGMHVVGVRKTGFLEDSKMVWIAPGDTVLAAFELERRPPTHGALIVDVSERGALVQIDGVEIGKSPILDYPILSGFHLLEVSRSGFLRESRTIQVMPGVQHIILLKSMYYPFLLFPALHIPA